MHFRVLICFLVFFGGVFTARGAALYREQPLTIILTCRHFYTEHERVDGSALFLHKLRVSEHGFTWQGTFDELASIMERFPESQLMRGNRCEEKYHVT